MARFSLPVMSSIFGGYMMPALAVYFMLYHQAAFPVVVAVYQSMPELVPVGSASNVDSLVEVTYYTDFIQSHEDWEFAGIYTDEGISATSMKHRSGFLSMIDDAMAGKIDLIVTKSVDTKGDVSPSELIQFSDRSTGSKPLGIWAFGRWLPLGGLLFCPEIGGIRAAGVHTVLTMHTLLTIAGGYR